MNSNIINTRQYPSCPILPIPPKPVKNHSKKLCLTHKQNPIREFLPNVLFQHMLSFISISDQQDLPCVSRRFKEVVYEARERFNWINQLIIFGHFADPSGMEDDSFVPYIKFHQNLNPSQKLSRKQVLAKTLPLIRNLEVFGFKAFTSALKSDTINEFPLKSLKLWYQNAYVDDASQGNPQIFNLIAQRCPHLTDLNIEGISNFEECQGLSAVFNLPSFSSLTFLALTAGQIKKLSEEINVGVPLHYFTIDCDLDSAAVLEEQTVNLLSKASSLLSIGSDSIDKLSDKTYLALAQSCKNLTVISLTSIHFTLNALTVLMQNCRHLSRFKNDKFLNILIQNQPSEGQEWYKYCPQLTYLELLGDSVTNLDRFRGAKVYKDEDTQYNTPYIVNMLKHLPNLGFLRINKIIQDRDKHDKIIANLDIDWIMRTVRIYNKKLKYLDNRPTVARVSDPNNPSCQSLPIQDHFIMHDFNFKLESEKNEQH